MIVLNTKKNDYLIIAMGTILIAVGANMIFEPVGLVTGGVSGIGIVLKKITAGGFFEEGIPLWLTNIIANIPLVLIGLKVKGKEFLKKTVFGALLLTVVLYFTMFIPLNINDMILGSFYGGAVTGLGVGLVISRGGSTGGSDLLASIIQNYQKQYSISYILMVVDAVIVAIGVLIFGLENAMYAIIAIFITTKVSDTVLEGLKFQKQIQIISKGHVEIAQRIMKEMGRGVTVTKAQGMYSLEEKMLLLCIISKKEVQKVMGIVADVDEKAFMIINDVREVRGEGFLSMKKS